MVSVNLILTVELNLPSAEVVINLVLFLDFFTEKVYFISSAEGRVSGVVSLFLNWHEYKNNNAIIHNIIVKILIRTCPKGASHRLAPLFILNVSELVILIPP